MRASLVVAGVAVRTPFGELERTEIALREAGSAATTVPVVDADGDWMRAALVLPFEEPHGTARAVGLAWPVMERALREAEPIAGVSALLVCAPLGWGTWTDACSPALAPSRHDWGEVGRALAARLIGLGAHVPPELVRVLPRGHAAGAVGVGEAAELLGSGRVAQVVLVGLDAHGERSTLERLDLLGWSRSRRSPEGFLPGEAAAVVVLRADTVAGREREAERDPTGGCVATLRGWATESESAQPSKAEALTFAVRGALDRWGGDARALERVTIDLNGDGARAREWSSAEARTLWRERATPAIEHPADRLGDVGAVSVPLHLALAARRARTAHTVITGRSESGTTLVVASSRDGLRGAVVVAPRPAPGREDAT